MILLGVQIFGWEIDTSLFLFVVSGIGMFSWWLILMYMNVHEIKEASKRRGKQLDVLMIKHEALTETLGTEGIEFGKKFKKEYDSNLKGKIEEYKIETA